MIDYESTQNSYLIIFEDIRLTKTKLKTDMTLYISPIAAHGTVYTVEKKAGNWEITSMKNLWVS